MKSYLKVKLDQRHFNVMEYKFYLTLLGVFTGYTSLSNDMGKAVTPSFDHIDLDN
jgi:hypothetical protein